MCVYKGKGVCNLVTQVCGLLGKQLLCMAQQNYRLVLVTVEEYEKMCFPELSLAFYMSVSVVILWSIIC